MNPFSFTVRKSNGGAQLFYGGSELEDQIVMNDVCGFSALNEKSKKCLSLRVSSCMVFLKLWNISFHCVCSTDMRKVFLFSYSEVMN